MKKSLISLILLCVCLGVRAQQATLRIDAQERHQHVTGFGGFVCSPQFGYNHMTQSDMKKVWGTGSTVGCNIMRLYIPIGRNAWGQSLQTAKQAKEMGLIVFASPWGQPAEWKTNGTINAKNEDGTTGKLKREYWDDYAKYLNDYVEYLRENGVETTDCLAGKAAGIMKERATFISDLWDLTSYFFVAPTAYDEKQTKKYWKGENPARLKEVREVLASIDDFSLENTEAVVGAWIQEKGYGMGQIMNTLRLALVGAGKGPGMYDVTAFIGKEECLKRIDYILTNLKPIE